MQFSKKDLIFSIITGLTTGFVAWKILVFLERPEFWGISMAWLLVAVPVLWILGVNLGYFLGRWMPFFNQFGKFAAIGFTNAAVDFGTLDLFIAKTGETAGVMYAVFKGTSFVIAMIHSYFWNKYWAFHGDSGNSGPEQAEKIFAGEFLRFFSVSVLALLINVAVASLVVNLVNPVLGLDAKTWANVGAVAGSAVALVFSFAGFKIVVFKK